MKFFDYFKPKWKHSDSSVRRDAVARLTKQKILTGIVKTDKDEYVRVAAVGNLTNQKLLAKIAKTDKSESVRAVAVNHLTDQTLLTEIAKSDDSKRIRLAAIENLADRDLLAEIAKNDKDKWMLILAEVEKLTPELYHIGLSDGYLSMEQGGKFDDNCRNIRAREIGERLNEMGGCHLMREVHSKIQQMQGPARQLESCWGYIGIWQP